MPDSPPVCWVCGRPVTFYDPSLVVPGSIVMHVGCSRKAHEAAIEILSESAESKERRRRAR